MDLSATDLQISIDSLAIHGVGAPPDRVLASMRSHLTVLIRTTGVPAWARQEHEGSAAAGPSAPIFPPEIRCGLEFRPGTTPEALGRQIAETVYQGGLR